MANDETQDDPVATLYSNAVIEALVSTANALGGQPDINAALAACTFSQAYLIAKLPRQLREAARQQCNTALVQYTAKFVKENHQSQLKKDQGNGD